MPISLLAARIAATASLSAKLGARSKPMVTAGNCSWCAIASGAVVRSKRRNRAERHLRAPPRSPRSTVRACAAANVIGSRWYSRHGFQHHAVLVGLAVDRRNLPLAERVVERVVDRLHGDAEAAGLFAVDLHEQAQPAFLRLRGDFAQQPNARAASRRASPPSSAPPSSRSRPACTDTARGSRAC